MSKKIDHAVDEAEDKIVKMREGVQQAGNTALDFAQRKVEEVGDVTKQKYDELKEAGQKQGEHAQKIIKNDPLKSVLIASGVGLIIGFLVGRIR